MSEKLRRGLMALFILVFCVAAVFFGRSLWEYHKGEGIYESAMTFVTEDEAAEMSAENEAADEAKNKEKKKIIAAPISKVKRTYTNIDFKGLQEVNADVIGWIQILGTQVDYPLVDASDNQYYLNHSYDGRRSSYGSVFLEPRNSRGMGDRHVILYGHNMVNKSMFGSLMGYKQQSYANSHPTITICLPDRNLTYQVFSAYTAHVNSAAYQLSFSSNASFENMISEMKTNSMISSNITPKAGEQILTLSTCTPAGAKDQRFVVNAVLISGNQPSSPKQAEVPVAETSAVPEEPVQELPVEEIPVTEEVLLSEEQVVLAEEDNGEESAQMTEESIE